MAMAERVKHKALHKKKPSSSSDYTTVSSSTLKIGEQHFSNGDVLAIRIQEGVTFSAEKDTQSPRLQDPGRWLCEFKKGGWGVVYAAEVDDPIDLGDSSLPSLPLSCFFRLSISQVGERQFMALQSYSSSIYLSHPKDKGPVSRSKNLKESEYIDTSTHPVWKMYKTLQGKPSPLHLNSGILHCGPGQKAPIWAIQSIPIDLLEKIDFDKRGKMESLFKKKKKERSHKTESMNAAGHIFSGLFSGDDKSPSKEEKKNKRGSLLGATPGGSYLVRNEMSPDGMRAQVSPDTIHLDEQPIDSPQFWQVAKKDRRVVKQLTLPAQSQKLGDLDVDLEKVYDVLKLSMTLLGVPAHETREHVRGIRASARISSKDPVDWNVLENSCNEIYFNLIQPSAAYCSKIRRVIMTQSRMRGFLVRNRRRKLLASLTASPLTPMEILKDQVSWARTLLKADDGMRRAMETFMAERTNPLRREAELDADNWIDVMTVDALFSAWMQFANVHLEWHKKINLCNEKWPSIVGLLSLMESYTKDVGEALLALGQQSQAIFETFENLRSLKEFIPFSAELALKKPLRVTRPSRVTDKTLRSLEDLSRARVKTQNLAIFLSSHHERASTASHSDGEDISRKRAKKKKHSLRKDKLKREHKKIPGSSSDVQSPKTEDNKEEVDHKGREIRKSVDLLDIDAEEEEDEEEEDSSCAEQSEEESPYQTIPKGKREEETEIKRAEKEPDPKEKRQKEVESGSESDTPRHLCAKSPKGRQISSDMIPKLTINTTKGEPSRPVPNTVRSLRSRFERPSEDPKSVSRRDSSFDSPDEAIAPDSEQYSSLMSFWNERASAPLRLAPISPVRVQTPISPARDDVCPKYLPGFGPFVGVCRRCKLPSTAHGESAFEGAQEDSQTEEVDQSVGETSMLEESTEGEGEGGEGGEGGESDLKDKEQLEDEKDKEKKKEKQKKQKPSSRGKTPRKGRSKRSGSHQSPKGEDSISLEGGEATASTDSLPGIKEDKEDKEDTEEEAQETQIPKNLHLLNRFKNSCIRLDRQNSDMALRSISRLDLRAEASALSSRNFDESFHFDYSTRKPFRWFITLPFEYLQFMRIHAKGLSDLMVNWKGTEWYEENNKAVNSCFSELQNLQTKTNEAVNFARFSSTSARFAQIQNFHEPEYDTICGDGPLRMLLVESNVLLLKDGALIERHLVMFTDLILLLKRSHGSGMWELHQEFKGMIYFGLVTDARLVETGEGACTILEFEDINSKKNDIVTIEIFGRHKEECHLWLERFRERMEANHVVFDKPIAQVVHQERGKIPYILKKTLRELIDRATETEGIFRIAGNLKRARYLRILFDKGMNRYVHPTVLKREEVHTIAALLKQYIRSLPEPLFSFETYQKVIVEQRGAGLKRKALLKSMTPACYDVMISIMVLLRLIVLNSEKTKMDSMNLATIFAPNIFRPSKGHKETHGEMDVARIVTKSLIDYYVTNPPTDDPLRD